MTGRDGTPRREARWFRLRPRSQASLETQVREEIDAHVALAVDHLVAHGVPRPDAERDARARFGDFDAALRRLYYTAQDRETRIDRRELLDELRQDTRLAFRMFRRAPAFFVAAVLTLAIGIGANGAVFSILQSALLQPLPYRNPGDLVMLWRSLANPPPVGVTRARVDRGALTAPMVLGWRKDLSGSVGEIAGVIGKGNLEAQFDATFGDRPTRLNGAFVTPNFFELLGVRAAHGRLFTPSDEAATEPLVVLGHALWQREFAGDPSIVGRPVTLVVGRSPRTPKTFIVAGVLPRGFHYTYPDEVEAWGLIRWADVASYDPTALGFTAVARLGANMDVTQARLRANHLRPGLEPAGPDGTLRTMFSLEPMHDWIVGEIRPSLQLLGSVAALLLLITCATVANGLLTKVSEREQELSVRTALGAGRSRLIRQLLTEGALLSIGGALAGTVLALGLQPVLRALLPASIPQVGEITVSARLLVFGAVMAAVTTILAAVAPAWGGTRFDAAATVTRGSRTASATRSTTRWRQGLIGVQSAIATALLVSASLLLMSFHELGQVPLGFEGDKVLAVEMRLLDAKYREPGAIARFQEDLIARVRAIPGIAEAGITSAVPFRGVDFLVVVGRPGVEQTHAVNGRYVDSGYFAVLRIPLRRGRLIGERDRDGERPVIVISESHARQAFGSVDPIGKQLQYSNVLEVVGVVGDVRYASMEKDPTPAVYFPRAQAPNRLICVVMRTRSTVGVGTVIPAIRRAIREADPALPAMNFATIDQIIDGSVANRRFYTVATASFATIALLLTIVGLIIVVARVVTERRRELAIRAALGATLIDLTRVATRDTLVAVCAGVLGGLAGAFAGSKLLTQFLFHVAPRSPTTYSAVALLVVSVALLAAWGPVRRFDGMALAGILRAE